MKYIGDILRIRTGRVKYGFFIKMFKYYREPQVMMLFRNFKNQLTINIKVNI